MTKPTPTAPTTAKFRADFFAIFVYIVVIGAFAAQFAMIAGLS